MSATAVAFLPTDSLRLTVTSGRKMARITPGTRTTRSQIEYRFTRHDVLRDCQRIDDVPGHKRGGVGMSRQIQPLIPLPQSVAIFGQRRDLPIGQLNLPGGKFAGRGRAPRIEQASHAWWSNFADWEVFLDLADLAADNSCAVTDPQGSRTMISLSTSPLHRPSRCSHWPPPAAVAFNRRIAAASRVTTSPILAGGARAATPAEDAGAATVAERLVRRMRRLWPMWRLRPLFPVRLRVRLVPGLSGHVGGLDALHGTDHEFLYRPAKRLCLRRMRLLSTSTNGGTIHRPAMIRVPMPTVPVPAAAVTAAAVPPAAERRSGREMRVVRYRSPTAAVTVPPGSRRAAVPAPAGRRSPPRDAPHPSAQRPTNESHRHGGPSRQPRRVVVPRPSPAAGPMNGIGSSALRHDRHNRLPR